MHVELSPFIVWIALRLVNTYSQIQVNIFSNNRDITKYHSFGTTTTTKTDNNDAKDLCFQKHFKMIHNCQIFPNLSIVIRSHWKGSVINIFVTSNFSFSHSVFYPFRQLSAIFVKFEIVVCKLFQFGKV